MYDFMNYIFFQIKLPACLFTQIWYEKYNTNIIV